MELQRSYFRAVIGSLAAKAAGDDGHLTKQDCKDVCGYAWDLVDVAIEFDRYALDHLLDLQVSEDEKRLLAKMNAAPLIQEDQ